MQGFPRAGIRILLAEMADLVRVARVEDELAASIAVGMLRSAGIRAMCRPAEHALAVFPLGSVDGNMGQFDVLVHGQNEFLARELLSRTGRKHEPGYAGGAPAATARD